MGGKSAQGTVISYENPAGSGTYVPFVNVKSFDGPSAENAEIDKTTLESVAKEFLPGMIDWGELSMTCNFDHSTTSHQQAVADMAARTVRRWRITFVTPTQNWTWEEAYPKGFPISGGVDALYEGNLTLRLSGAPTITS